MINQSTAKKSRFRKVKIRGHSTPRPPFRFFCAKNFRVADPARPRNVSSLALWALGRACGGLCLEHRACRPPPCTPTGAAQPTRSCRELAQSGSTCPSLCGPADNCFPHRGQRITSSAARASARTLGGPPPEASGAASRYTFTRVCFYIYRYVYL